MRSSALIQNVLDLEIPLVERGEGVWLFDTDGKRYFDACSGAVVSSIGHSHPYVLARMADQAACITFVHRGAFSSAAAERLAQRVSALSDFSGVWLVNSGSEAMEAAMQLALQYHRERGEPDRTWFLSHRRGYHGNTLGGLSLSGHSRRAVVEGLAHDFNGLDEPSACRRGRSLQDTSWTAELLDSARAVVEDVGDRLAGVVVEPVGGATLGATVPPDGYLAGLRSLCDEYGALFVADEVMSGVGRTGRFLAVEHWDVRPDLVAIGKGLSAGYSPIAATLVSEHVLTTLREGSGRVAGGHTFGGNPLSSATALAVLDVMEQENLMERGVHLARILETELTRLASDHPVIEETRGLGCLRALEFRRAPAVEGRPIGSTAARFAHLAREAGAIVYPVTGGFNDAVLIAPPLSTTSEELAELIETLDQALEAFETDGSRPQEPGPT